MRCARPMLLFVTLCFLGHSVHAELRAERNIVYASVPGADPSLNSLDVYTPAEGTNHPVIVWVHGGGWRIGDKGNVGEKAACFTRAGCVFVSINYRLSPAVKHPAHVQDVASAVGWVYKNIAARGGDPQRIYLIGHSAGAHLVALVAADLHYLEAAGVPAKALKGVVPLDGGGYDIPALIAFNRLNKDRMEVAFGSDPAVWRDASPVTHVAAGKGIPPFLLIHAGIREASAEQARELAQALKKAGVAAEVKHAPDKNHMTLNRQLGAVDDVPTQWILAFLAQHR